MVTAYTFSKGETVRIKPSHWMKVHHGLEGRIYSSFLDPQGNQSHYVQFPGHRGAFVLAVDLEAVSPVTR